MPDIYDAIIVGGGHNGLVTSAYLAGRGLRTLVLERRPFVGGASVTEEPWPGYKVSTAAYVVSLLRREVSRRDAEVYEEYERTLNRLSEFVEPLLMRTPPDPTSSRPRDLLALFRLGRLARRLKKDLYSEVDIMVGSAKDFLDSWFESEEMNLLLCGQAVIGT